MTGNTDQSTVSSDAAVPNRLTRTIALVGMMGAGKSTVGRKLAQVLGADFVDSDEEIERAAGLSIPEIFAQHGEAEFRRGERRVIERLLAGPPIVLATGGGAYLDPETRDLLRRRAVTVWVRANIETLWKRVSRRRNRPLLEQPDPKQALMDIYEARKDIYALADLVVDSADGPASDVVDAICEALERT